jgi:hypothetical protein
MRDLNASAPMPVRVLGWRPLVKGALRGFVTVQLGRSLKLTDLSIVSSNGKLWVAFRDKPLLADGKALLDDKGKQRYVTIMEWTDKAAADRFSAAVIAAGRAEFGPEALEPAA